MKHYIDKSALVAEIEKLRKDAWESFQKGNSTEEQYYIRYGVIQDILASLDTLEVKDLYEQCIQYASIESGIKAHAEDYSFNIESELFHQLTKEQQKLWRKEIEQAVISGGYNGLDLARDQRYKENHEVKEADLEKEQDKEWNKCVPIDEGMGLEIASIEHEQFDNIAKHFFELGLKTKRE